MRESINHWHPELIPILREIDYHTHYLGETENGQLFFGYETFVFPNRFKNLDWQNERLEYALIYLFDLKGNYLETIYKCAGKTSQISIHESTKLLKELLSGLGNLTFKNIRVKPFKTEIDGIEFGLIPDNELETVELQPSSTIAFSAPWDGIYDT